jgi:uncharacterized integral membrane protein
MAVKNDSPPSEPGLRVKGMPVRAKPVGLGLLAVITIWFIVTNTESVKIHLWVLTVMAPLWVVLVITLLVGGVLGWFMLARSRARRERR